jgi:hypothetical protein
MDTVVVGVADLVSVDELSLKLTVSPNPTTGIIHFSEENIHLVKILTLDGKQVGQLEPMNGKIDLSEFHNGFYLLEIYIRSRTQVLKVLKADQ